jgi:YfiH family protein
LESNTPAFIPAGFLVCTIFVVVSKRPLLTIPRFEAVPWLVHGFGTSAWKGEDFSRDEELKPFRPVLMKQLHSDIIHRIEKIPGKQLGGDALVTGKPGFLLVIKTADCLPVLIVDERKRIVAAAHCGWRSTAARILVKLIGRMRRDFGSVPRDLIAAFGPCIGAECYEVREDVRDRFKAAGFSSEIFDGDPDRPGRHSLNLRKINIRLLEDEGLRKENIFSVDLCTSCDDRFISFRQSGDRDRRMLNFVGKK